MIYYISPGQLGTTAYITRAVALIYVIGGLQNWIKPEHPVYEYFVSYPVYHAMCAMRYARLVKVQCVGNGRTLFDLKFERRL